MLQVMTPTQHRTGIPLVGLGTWKLYEKECEETVRRALDLGYRHIDTADLYENHAVIGEVIRPWKREELYLVSKIKTEDLSPQRVLEVVPRFLDELQTPYLDLLLVHWPDPELPLAPTLEAMLTFQGVVRAVGLSNCVRSHLSEIRPYHFPILVNQIELHPYLQRKSLRAACLQDGIALTAYRPLAQGALEKDPLLKQIGKKYGKSASQVALRWLVQQEIVVIPKAANPVHLKKNLEIFDFVLSSEEMALIATLDQDKRFCAPDYRPYFPD